MKKNGWLTVVLLLAVAAGITWYLRTRDSQPKGDGEWTKTGEDATPPGPNVTTPMAIKKAELLATYRLGLAKLKDDKLIEARTLLAKAYRSGVLGEQSARQARETLTDLADRTLFNRSAYVNPADPYVTGYEFRFGEYLDNTRDAQGRPVKGIISRLELWVPAGCIVLANGLADATKFQAGRRYKMIRGPFHAVVYKSERVMDVYLRDLFVRRLAVCVGAPATPTPEGRFRVARFAKTSHSIYTPPIGRGGETLHPGDAGYPLDPRGHNIKLEGIEGTKITDRDGYAIHGTSDPDCIGKAVSLGCIRLNPADIQWLYAMLYETKSTVTIKP